MGSVTIIAPRTATDVDLSLTVNNNGGIIGLTALVAIRDGDTNGSYLDFADDTFKGAGWATREAAMTDIGGGHYRRALDISAITNLPGGTEELIAEYRTTGAVVSVAQDRIELEGVLTSQQVRDAMKLTPTAGAPAAGSVDEHLDTIITDVAAVKVDTAAILLGVTRLLGLNHDNSMLDEQVYDINGDMTSGRLRVFANAAALALAAKGAGDDVDSEIARWAITVTYSAARQADDYRMAREL